MSNTNTVQKNDIYFYSVSYNDTTFSHCSIEWAVKTLEDAQALMDEIRSRAADDVISGQNLNWWTYPTKEQIIPMISIKSISRLTNFSNAID